MPEVSEKIENSVVKNWRLKSIIVEYSQKDIFNADETSLFFKCMPNKTLRPTGEKCFNGVKSKERESILYACSMTYQKDLNF